MTTMLKLPQGIIEYYFFHQTGIRMNMNNNVCIQRKVTSIYSISRCFIRYSFLNISIIWSEWLIYGFLNHYSKINFIDVIEMILSDLLNRNSFTCWNWLFDFIKAIVTEFMFPFPNIINHKISLLFINPFNLCWGYF